MSVIIEHFAGAFPIWLSPIQVTLLPVSDKHIEAAEKVAIELRAIGARVVVDSDAGTIGAKVRKSEIEKIPLSVVFGDKESSGEPWQVRVRGSKDAKILTAEEFKTWIQEVSKSRSA